MQDLPRLVALCGNPKSGKSEAQKFLQSAFNYEPVDDGEALRDFAMCHLGLKHEDVYTQEGKARYTEILGKKWQNRDILGTLGAQLEDMFGEHIMPWMATRTLDPTRRYSFGSVRKRQGHFFKKIGGMVLEIKNPKALASPYDFDRYDSSCVDAVIYNDTIGLYKPEVSLLDFHTKLATSLYNFADAKDKAA